MADSLRRLDTIVSQQLPDFIRSEYPTFVTFLEKFYEWSSTTGPIAAAYRLPDSQDIDATDEELLVHFKNEFLVHVPDKILVDKRFLVKHIREFYRAKSTEDSYRFLFRVLFGTDLDFYYPRTNILVPSSGVWQQDKTLRVFPVVGNPTDLINKKLIGTDSGASGLVEDVLHMLVGGFNFYELFFSSTSIEGTFLASEDVASEAGDIIAVALPCVTSITLTNKGTGYIEGQKITFSGSSGSGALANIGRVGSAGEILSIKMIDPGVGYFDVPTLSFPDNGSGTDAQGEALVTAQITYPGYYIGERSFLSASDKLQDSYYYQQFSYVLKSSESTQSYKEAVKNLVHPAGLKMFGSLLDIQQFSNTKIKIFDAVISGIAESILTKLLIFSEMLSGGVSLGQGKLTLSHTIKESSTSFLLGPCLRSLDRDAFKYLPNEDNWLDPANIEGVNAGYWDEFPNTPISVFSDYTFDDFLNTPYRKIALCPDAIIYIHVAASPELENDVLLPCPQIVLFGRDPNTFGSEDPDNLVYLSIASIASSGEIPGTTHTENNFITSPSLSTSISGQTPQIVAPNNSFVSIPLGTVSSSAKTPGTTYTQNNFITLAQGSIASSGKTPQATTHEELTTWTVSSNLIYKNGSLFIPSGYYHIGDRTGRDATDIYDMVNYGANTICTRIEQSTADLAFLDTCHGLGIYVMVEMDSEPLDLIAATKDHPAVMGYLAGFTADPYTQFDDVDSKGVSTTDVQTYCDIIKAAAPTKLTYMTGFTVSTPSTWDDYVGYSDVYAKYNYPDAWTAPDSIEWALSLDYAAINAVTDCAFTTCHGQFLSGNIPTALQVRNGFWQQIFRTVVGNIVYAYYDGSNNLRSETGIKTEFQSLFSEISAISAYLGSGTLTPRTTNRSLVWSFTWTKSGQSDLLVVINTNNASKSMNYSCGISGTSLSKKWSRYSSGLSISGSTITGTIASLDTHVYIINH